MLPPRPAPHTSSRFETGCSCASRHTATARRPSKPWGCRTSRVTGAGGQHFGVPRVQQRGGGSEIPRREGNPDETHTSACARSAPACLIVALTAAPAGAQQPESTPGGPWAQPNQNESLSAIRDYGELVSTLERLVVAQPRRGRARRYSPFRAKGSGRAIPIVTIGSGDRGHRDHRQPARRRVHREQLGGRARPRADEQRRRGASEIREAVTVTVMPRVNIDGFDATPIGEPWRAERRPVLHGRPVSGVLRRAAAAMTSTATTPTWSATRSTTRTPGRSASARATTRCPRRWRSGTRTTPRAAPAGVDVVMDLHHQGIEDRRRGPDGHRLDAVAERDRDRRPARHPPAVRSGRLPLQAGRVHARCRPSSGTGTRTSRATAARRRRGSRGTPTACSAPRRC